MPEAPGAVTSRPSAGGRKCLFPFMEGRCLSGPPAVKTGSLDCLWGAGGGPRVESTFVQVETWEPREVEQVTQARQRVPPGWASSLSPEFQTPDPSTGFADKAVA